jgi:hypothetical protein
MPDETWTPYGLEAIRARHVRRRRLLTALILAGVALLALALTTTGTQSSVQILHNGQVVSDNGNQISIDLPDQQPPKDGPVTVSLTPGRVTLADTAAPAQGPQISRADVPVFSGAPALNWNYYLLVYGPWALLALALIVLAKRRGKHDEVNFGVFKGSMPLEMISAHARDQVFTTREAKQSVFGKRREDHLPSPVLRVPQEGDP